ncbi:hypothetical protein DA803_01640 [[Mycoplasma] phocae]|uniref:Uncharacterized protein n=1 Tax=[Mycoplasma] phocae TaxID=142651 RepID=A0A2Z5IQE1_9BACT|nr:hypothetical protein DA803_01640 [[Mycoplasma] phocae]
MIKRIKKISFFINKIETIFNNFKLNLFINKVFLFKKIYDQNNRLSLILEYLRFFESKKMAIILEF